MDININLYSRISEISTFMTMGLREVSLSSRMRGSSDSKKADLADGTQENRSYSSPNRSSLAQCGESERRVSCVYRMAESRILCNLHDG